MDARLANHIDVWRQACASFADLASDLEPDEWRLPSGLDGWSVQDVVAHCAALEADLAGHPTAPVELPDLPRLRDNLMSQFTETGVLARRDAAPRELITEFTGAVAERTAALAAQPDLDPAGPATGFAAAMNWTWSTLLSNRPLDIWVHEQDVRRAVGRPGGFDQPGTAHVVDVFTKALPFVVGKRVKAPVGTVVRFVVGDGVDVRVGVDGNGRGGFVPDGEPDATLVMAVEPFTTLAAGRRAPRPDDAQVQGDADLAGRILARLAVTP